MRVSSQYSGTSAASPAQSWRGMTSKMARRGLASAGPPTEAEQQCFPPLRRRLEPGWVAGLPITSLNVDLLSAAAVVAAGVATLFTSWRKVNSKPTDSRQVGYRSVAVGATQLAIARAHNNAIEPTA